jgi:hypothetical protein
MENQKASPVYTTLLIIVISLFVAVLLFETIGKSIDESKRKNEITKVK